MLVPRVSSATAVHWKEAHSSFGPAPFRNQSFLEALHVAVEKNHIPLVSYLLGNGFTVDKQSIEYAVVDTKSTEMLQVF